MAPEKKEIERKFRVMNFSPELIPADSTSVSILQTYLVCEGPGERRVRYTTHGWHSPSTYHYTEKLPTGESGTRIERERKIDFAEYQSLYRERDKTLLTIWKTRHSFSFGGKTLELDVFKCELCGLVMLEIELQHRNEEITLPPGWKLIEVTDHPAYKNYALAKRGKKPHASYWFNCILEKLSQLFYRYTAGD